MSKQAVQFEKPKLQRTYVTLTEPNSGIRKSFTAYGATLAQIVDAIEKLGDPSSDAGRNRKPSASAA